MQQVPTWARSTVMKSRDQVTFSPTSCRQTKEGRERTLQKNKNKLRNYSRSTELVQMMSTWIIPDVLCCSEHKLPLTFQSTHTSQTACKTDSEHMHLCSHLKNHAAKKKLVKKGEENKVKNLFHSPWVYITKRPIHNDIWHAAHMTHDGHCVHRMLKWRFHYY